MGNLVNKKQRKEEGSRQVKVFEKLICKHPISNRMVDIILAVPIYDHHLSLTFDEVIVLINKNSPLDETYSQAMAMYLTDERRLPIDHPQRCKVQKPHTLPTLPISHM